MACLGDAYPRFLQVPCPHPVCDVGVECEMWQRSECDSALWVALDQVWEYLFVEVVAFVSLWSQSC